MEFLQATFGFLIQNPLLVVIALVVFLALSGAFSADSVSTSSTRDYTSYLDGVEDEARARMDKASDSYLRNVQDTTRR